MLLFALLLHPVILKIEEIVPTLAANVWELDDGLLAGSQEEVALALQTATPECEKRGLIISTSATAPSNPKSAVWCPQHEMEDDPLGLGVLKNWG